MNIRNIIILFVIVLFFGFFIPKEFFINQKETTPDAQNIPVILENVVETTTIIPKIATSTSRIEKVVKPSQKTTQNSISAVVNPQKTTVVQAPQEPAPDFEVINQFAQKAIVNLLCNTNSRLLSSITGSGIIIDPRGIILTNAHIGQYWLLHDFPSKDSTECVVRAGSPAYPRYHAELMYISPRWIENNKTLLRDSDPKGTGENDFAFLRITDTTDLFPQTGKSSLPEKFSYIQTNTRENISENETVLLDSYPAEFLGGTTILQNLFVTSAITTIQKIFTFKETTVDLLSIGGTIVSQKGASGGAVVDNKATLIGMIVTESSATTTSQRDLRAITLAYINRSLKEETNGGLVDFLSQDPVNIAKIFQASIQETLTKLLVDALNK